MRPKLMTLDKAHNKTGGEECREEVNGGIKPCRIWIQLLQSLKTSCLPSQTVPEELQNGRGFGYVVAFRPYGKMIWMLTVLASADASRYVFRNESVRPFSPFEVKVGVYNNKGEGPFSPTTVVYSAEEGMAGLCCLDVCYFFNAEILILRHTIDLALCP